MSTTVIFSNFGDEDTNNLRKIWENLPSVNLIEVTSELVESGVNVDQIVDYAINNEFDTLIFAGHGSHLGLFNPAGGYLFDASNISLVVAKRVICIWCYASSFCLRHNFNCLCSSMFISNPGEALVSLGIFCDQSDITRQNVTTYSIINNALKESLSLEECYYNVKQLLDDCIPVTDYDLVNVFNINGITLI